MSVMVSDALATVLFSALVLKSVEFKALAVEFSTLTGSVSSVEFVIYEESLLYNVFKEVGESRILSSSGGAESYALQT